MFFVRLSVHKDGIKELSHLRTGTESLLYLRGDVSAGAEGGSASPRVSAERFGGEKQQVLIFS